MKKEDLKYGNVIELEDGNRYLYTFYLSDVLRNKYDHYFLKLNYVSGFCKEVRYLDDLNGNFIFNGYADGHTKIMKVYKDYTLKEVLWERKETPKMSEHDLYILRGLDTKYHDWYIGRDSDGDLVLYNSKPFKKIEVNIFNARIVSWYPELGSKSEEFNIYKNFFQNIKYTDDECYAIRELLGE